MNNETITRAAAIDMYKWYMSAYNKLPLFVRGSADFNQAVKAWALFHNMPLTTPGQWVDAAIDMYMTKKERVEDLYSDPLP
mgnify:CR=1 FL=1